METSNAMAFRIVAMLACLVLLPLAAVFGTSLPEVARRLLDSSGGRAGQHSDEPSRGLGSPVSPAASHRPKDPRVPNKPIEPSSSGLPLEGSEDPALNADCSSRIGLSDIDSARSSLLPEKPLFSPDAFAYIQQRLRELGARHYLLETWGIREELYRFYCKVAIGDDPDHTRYFEATHSDPLEAMARVLRDVEGWRAGR